MQLSVLDTVKIIDADTHVVEPYDLWTSRVPSKLAHKVPHVVWDADKGQDVWTLGNEGFAAAAGPAMTGWHEYPPGRPPRLDEAEASTWDATKRLKVMDEYGIDTQVLYPNVAGFGGGRYLELDEDLRLLCVQAYNDWLDEWTGVAPERFIKNCSLPFWDIERSVKEMRRAHANGHRGIIFSSMPHKFGQPHIASRHWDPIWAEAQALGMPVNFHIGSGGIGDFAGLSEHPPALDYAIISVLIFSNNANSIIDLVMGGVCERFPELQFVSVESGVGWVPFVVEAMDWQWKACGLKHDYANWLLPSEYFKRQFSVSFWFETAATLEYAVQAIGADRILYETDFPHPTSQTVGPASPGVYPREYIGEAFKNVSDEDARLMLEGNAARLYNWK